ncbi:MAG: SH3 domain-containing protein [Nitrospinota bacterium]|nr:SH3 domain-containing protein [Nitrospinota bacterium]
MIAEGSVSVSSLNMRFSPGGPVIKLLPLGTELEILAREGSWFYVRASGLTGFVGSKYINVKRQENKQPDTHVEVVKRSGNVNIDLLNMRMSPGGEIISRLPRNTTVNILEDEGSWLKVQANGLTGYVTEEYITLEKLTTLPPPQKKEDVAGFKYEDERAYAPDGTKFGKKYKLGIYNAGSTSIAEFIQKNKSRFKNISQSLLNVMKAVSENEGKFESINTWDNCFLSAGVFQWTTGPGSEAGELAAVLEKLKERFPDSYEKYFGRYGLVPEGVRYREGATPVGYFKIGGVLLGDSTQKNTLRSLPWAYRFWLAGHDDDMREIQTLHAASRIDLFYKQDKKKIGEFHVCDYITSEYGVALLLDQHVNRPGHVPRILGDAVNELSGKLDIKNPQKWKDDDERMLIEKYLELRTKTSMTHPTHRAETVFKQVKAGVISDKRGTFKLSV